MHLLMAFWGIGPSLVSNISRIELLFWPGIREIVRQAFALSQEPDRDWTKRFFTDHLKSQYAVNLFEAQQAKHASLVRPNLISKGILAVFTTTRYPTML